MEAAEVLCGKTTSQFDWSDPSQARFCLEAEGHADPFTRVLEFLAACEVHMVAVKTEKPLTMDNWGLPTAEEHPAAGFPMPAPNAPAMLPARLRAGHDELRVDHWGDQTRHTGRDNVKFWGGSRGLPGAAIFKRNLDPVRANILESRPDPFSLGHTLAATYRLDWRHDYVPVDTGFSLNAHSQVVSVGYPLVELLGVIGLSHARPRRLSPRDKLRYDYFVSSARLPASLQRYVLGQPDPLFDTRHFSMRLGWAGQKDKARCITSVTEITHV
jgi:CRISPR-associated protein Csx14